MKTSHLLLPLAAAAISVLVACGGGGSSGSAATAAGQGVVMSTYITDNLTQDFSQVWVQILKIAAVDDAGNEVVLYQPSAADAANPVNLADLAAVGQLLSQANVPAGTFHRVEVTLADQIELVPRDGSATITATLGGNGSPVTIPVEVEVNATSSTALVLDFDLARFTFDPATRQVVPTIARRDAGDIDKFLRNQAELHGTVVSVGTDSFVVDDRHLGAGVTVKLAKDAVIFDEQRHVVVDLNSLTPGVRIEARVVVLPKAQAGDPTVVQAALVRIEPANDDPQAAAPLEGEGVVTAVDQATTGGVTSTTITVELHEANFMPASGTIKVDVTSAVFSHGMLADLAVGQRVEFRGTGSSAGVTATRLEIEGAPSEREREEHPDTAFAEAQGTVDSVSGSTFVLTVPDTSNELAPGKYTVDAAQAMFEQGRLDCLAAGETVEASGTIDPSTTPNPTITARVVEIDGGCPVK